MKYLILGFFLCISTHLFAQGNIPTVPSSIEIANVKLKITDDARKVIQKDVNALRASDKYFRMKLDRVNLYFPIIERVLREEGVPEDIKYLSIQESALISDAVSSANAVGYWQFKDFTGREVGLRVDNKVDERKNIVAATHGAAKYFKRNNFFFKNWIYAVSAYQAGPGGAKKYVDESNYGSDKLTITSKTHWYVLKFIAHVIAFKDEIGAPHSEGLKLMEYDKGAGKTIDELARQFDVDSDLMLEYNKWLAHGKIPDDKTYYVIVPITGKAPKELETQNNQLANRTIKEAEPTKYPDHIAGDIGRGRKVIFIKINGLEAIMASNQDDLRSLAEKTNLSESRFMKYNDLTPKNHIQAGEIYYSQSKRNRSPIRYHVAKYDETLWDISQKYGIKLKKLAKKNHMEIADNIKPGRVMWLNKKRPSGTPVEYHEIQKPAPEEKPVVKTAPVKKQPTPTINKEEPVQKELTPQSTPPVTEELPKSETPRGERIIHIVQPGQTLWKISTLYEATVQQIEDWNRLSPGAPISPGQELSIYAKRVAEEPPKITTTKTIREKEPEPRIINEKPDKTPDFHTVEAGEGLWGISRKYGLTTDQLMEWNGLPDSSIKEGENLLLHAPEEPEGVKKFPTEKKEELEVYVVKAGDNLSKISREYNMTVDEIMKLNGLETTSLSVGDQIKVKRK